MTQPRILVTSAAGKIGAAVVAELCQRGWPVRAMVRKQDARSERLRSLGAEIAVADLFDPDQLVGTLRGTTRAFFIPPFEPHVIQSAVAFSMAARETGLEAIVGLSQWLASPAHPAPLTRQHWLMDRMFAAMPGIAHTVLNPGYFADNYLRLTDVAAIMGVFPVITGDSRNAPPSNEDIARVAAAVLMNPDRHAGRSYRPTGPRLLSAHDMAPLIAQAVGRRVRAVNMPWWMFVRAARLQGEQPYLLSLLRHYVEDHKQGAFEHGAPTDDVMEVTGAPAEDFAVTARRDAALPYAQRTMANRTRVFGNFARVPATPAYDLAGLDLKLAIPVMLTPRLAMGDPRWRAEHSRRPPAANAEILPVRAAG